MRIDLQHSMIEVTRWYVLVALDAGRPSPVSEDILLRALGDASLHVTLGDLRRELDYLKDRKLIDVAGEDLDHWEASLTAAGVDVVEYTVECRPGIARPPKRQ